MRDIQFLADPTSGELRVGASVAVAIGLVSVVIDRLSRQHPRLRFDVVTGDTREIFRALGDRELDLAVVHLVDPIGESSLKAEGLFHDPHVVVAGPRSRWTRRPRLKLRDLAAERWVLPPVGSPYGFLVTEAFLAAGVNPPRAVVNSTLPIRSALLATGHDLSMVPRIVLNCPGNQRMLRALSVEWPSTARPLATVTLKNRTLNPVAKLFTDNPRGGQADRELQLDRPCANLHFWPNAPIAIVADCGRSIGTRTIDINVLCGSPGTQVREAAHESHSRIRN
jgi:DNA-binding transcriptional LysR family regulator